jgi:hypothetical protein
MNGAAPTSFETWLSARAQTAIGRRPGSIGSKRNGAMHSIRCASRAYRRQARGLALYQPQAFARAGVCQVEDTVTALQLDDIEELLIPESGQPSRRHGERTLRAVAVGARRSSARHSRDGAAHACLERSRCPARSNQRRGGRESAAVCRTQHGGSGRRTGRFARPRRRPRAPDRADPSLRRHGRASRRPAASSGLSRTVPKRP